MLDGYFERTMCCWTRLRLVPANSHLVFKITHPAQALVRKITIMSLWISEYGAKEEFIFYVYRLNRKEKIEEKKTLPLILLFKRIIYPFKQSHFSSMPVYNTRERKKGCVYWHWPHRFLWILNGSHLHNVYEASNVNAACWNSIGQHSQLIWIKVPFIENNNKKKVLCLFLSITISPHIHITFKVKSVF